MEIAFDGVLHLEHGGFPARERTQSVEECLGAAVEEVPGAQVDVVGDRRADVRPVRLEEGAEVDPEGVRQ